jgi:RNA polymerase sigma-70 factor (ECF subfamily)
MSEPGGLDAPYRCRVSSIAPSADRAEVSMPGSPAARHRADDADDAVGADSADSADSPSVLRDVPDVRAAFRDGDVAALGTVYDRYSRGVWSVAMSVLRDRALAEDATQEVFLRAWRASATFDPRRELAPWLFTIARRTAVDLLRSETRPTQGGHVAEEDGAVVAMPGIEHAYETWQVRLALDELPEDERTVVRLSHFEQMTHREIADALAVPLGTVKSRSHRAHRRLAERLAHLMSGGDA